MGWLRNFCKGKTSGKPRANLSRYPDLSGAETRGERYRRTGSSVLDWPGAERLFPFPL